MPVSDTERTADPKADRQQLGLIAFPALDQIACSKGSSSTPAPHARGHGIGGR